MDTVISLEGFCQKSPLCSDDSWRELEHVQIAIGQRRLANNNKDYGFALYKREPATGALTLITLENASQSLLNVLAKIGLPLKNDEQESMLMSGDFWPKASGMFDKLSTMLLP